MDIIEKCYAKTLLIILLQRAGVPLFSITNNPDDIRVQMYILDFIQRLDHSPS